MRKSRATKDWTGHKFGRWTVLKFHRTFNKRRMWACKCQCGVVRDVDISNLKFGITNSCGCLKNEQFSERAKILSRKHGLCGTYIHKAWDSMKSRCQWPEHKSYSAYGGRGIKVCARLNSSPANLLAIIGHRPNKGFSVDRIDTNKNYSCGDCEECKSNGWKINIRWNTSKGQCRNKRNNVFVKIGNDKKTIPEWSEISGINRATLWRRLKRGEVGDLFLAPLHEHHQIRL